MIYTPNVGKIYDINFFFIESSNQEEIDKDYIKIYDDSSFMIDFFEQIKKEAGKIPDILSPLFYHKNGAPSPISSFFSSQIDFSNYDIDSFIIKLTTNANLIYQKNSRFHI